MIITMTPLVVGYIPSANALTPQTQVIRDRVVSHPFLNIKGIGPTDRALSVGSKVLVPQLPVLPVLLFV